MTKLTRALILAAPIAAASLWGASDASACGGCFGPPTEPTEVTGHRMILSISPMQTTLWDEITYSGDPSSFAWVLPIKGMATIGLSSDALFGYLDEFTAVSVSPVYPSCPYVGGYGGSGGSSANGGGGGSSGGGVTVVSQQVVGPYETVQLSATDPTALADWLAQHGYNIPGDIQPVIDQYVNEQFDFIALKLVPGKGINAMRPVRITTPGASPVLPLRMVAAGTGTITPITLWVMGGGRYTTTNLPSSQIDPAKLVWDWDTSSSNLAEIQQDIFTASDNKGWIIEAGEPFSQSVLQGSLQYLVETDAQDSGYVDDMGNPDFMTEMADLEALFSNIPDGLMWVTRMKGELSREALAADLQLGASASQHTVTRTFVTTQTKGTPPSCPSGQGGSGGSGTGTHQGCVTSSSRERPDGAVVTIAIAAFLLRRRRRR